MAASLIVSTGTVADAPGYGQNSHLFYAVNTALYWHFTYKSASATTLYARYSSDLVTWSDPTNSTFTLAATNSGHGVGLGVAYANISSTDVVHLSLFTVPVAGDKDSHVRATLAGTTVTWGTEVTTTQGGSASGVTKGKACGMPSDGHCIESSNVAGDFNVARATNADLGSSWATGFGTVVGLFSANATATSSAFRPLSSGGKLIALGDNGAVTGTPTNIEYSLFGGATWSPATATDVFATNVSIDTNDWGAALRTDTDVHAVRRNDATSTFTHRRWNGTIWSAGSAIGNNTCKAGAGLAMVSDGTTVWLFIIDSDAANTVRYNTWTVGGGWAGWTALETTTQVRKFITASYSATKNTIAVAWAQTNGANFDLMVEALSVGGVTFTWQQLVENQMPAEYLTPWEITRY